MTTFVLIHGGWGGGFVWDEVRADLTSRGHDVIAVDQLTSVGDDPALLGDLRSDAAQVRSILDDVGAPVVVAGHSSGVPSSPRSPTTPPSSTASTWLPSGRPPACLCSA